MSRYEEIMQILNATFPPTQQQRAVIESTGRPVKGMQTTDNLTRCNTIFSRELTWRILDGISGIIMISQLI